MDVWGSDSAKRSEDGAWPSSGLAWYAVAVLFIAYTFSFADRFILTLLIEPIKQDLGLSDTRVSLLHGLAFAVFYTVTGVPIGRMADRYSRRTQPGRRLPVQAQFPNWPGRAD